MKRLKSINFNYLWLVMSLVASGFATNSLAQSSSLCSEDDLLKALEKAGFKSGLTKELEGMAGSWSTQIKTKKDPEKPWTTSEGRSDFRITKDGKHLIHEFTQQNVKTRITLSTFNAKGSEKKYAMATCDQTGNPPIVMSGLPKESVIKVESPDWSSATLLKNTNEMSSRLSILKKDTPTSLEPREIAIEEVSYRRIPAPN